MAGALAGEKEMRKRWVSLICLIMGAAALWISGKYSETARMNADKNKAERTGMENTRLSFGGGEQGESGEEVSYEVYVSQYTLDTGYTMRIFQVGGMEDKVLEDKINESLSSRLYTLEEPWFSPENISENKPVIHYRTDRYLSVEYSFEYLAAYYQGSSSWHHCVTVDMQSGEVVYFDDLIDLSEAFAKKVKYDSVLHMEGYSFWMEEDNTVLANRYVREMGIESILNGFQTCQTAFYLEEGKICFTVPYDSVYEIEWILLDDIEDYLKVPKWTECSEHTGEEASVPVGQEMPDVQVEFLPELGYHGLHRISTRYSGPFICWKDVLCVGNAVYRREGEIYRRTDESVREWLGAADDVDIYSSCQWENFLIFGYNGLILDMDSGQLTAYSSDSWWDDCVFQGKLYYREQGKGVFCRDLLSGEVETVYAGAGVSDFMIRDNGDMIIKITREADSEEWVELWLLPWDGQGDANAEKIWQSENHESIMLREFNEQGILFWRSGGAGSSSVRLTGDGETEEIVWEKWVGNNIIIAEEGYFLWDSQRLSEEEKAETLGDFTRTAKAAVVVDSISYYDFQGNKLKTWRLIGDEMLESGYRLVDIVYGNGEIVAFYENVLLDDLYISRVQPEAEGAEIGLLIYAKNLKFSIGEGETDLSSLGGLTELESLDIDIQDGCSPDLSFVSYFGQLKELRITFGDGVDLSPLGSLSGLQSLSIDTWTGNAGDLSFLKRLHCLEEIAITRYCEIEDLSFFQDMPYLRELTIAYAADGDLNCLSGLANLESLSVIGGNIRNPEALSNSVHLKSLSLYDNSLDARCGGAERVPFDMQAFADLSELERLDLYYIDIGDISPLAGLKNLRHISLVKTNVSDILPLAGLDELEELHIFGNRSSLVEEQAEKLFREVEYLIVTEEMPEDYGGQDYLRATKEQWDALPEIPPALDTFGKYLEELYREGRRTELDSQVISRRLSLKEAALLAEGSPLLEHIRAYEEDELTILTGGICILAADVNGDGLEDLIEYGPDAENADTANLLNIYLGKEGGGFGLSYAQPLFSTKVEWSDIIEVVRHGEETYLLFRDRTRSEYSGWKEEGVLAAYWLLDGRPMGKLNLDYVCSDVNMTITENAGAWDAGFLTEHRLSLYHVDYQQHCRVECDWPGSGHGTGETEIFPRQDERTNEEYEALCDGYVRKYRAQQEPYAGEWDGDLQWHYNITGMTTMYESDLNNDGAAEKYLKAVKALWMCETGFLSLGYPSALPHITGEYYGVHEGRYGLMYYIESEGKETDFFEMCGLDIWAGEMTPLYFWVEQTERGNVTYISYQDGDGHRQRIEGYLIQGDSYERVLCAECVPEIECSVSYMAMEETRGVDYIIRRTRDGRSLELEWEERNERQESVNRNIRVLLEDKMGAEAFLEGEEWKYMTVRFHPVEADREKLVVDCMIFYNNPNNTPATDHSQYFRVSIDLKTGECREGQERDSENFRFLNKKLPGEEFLPDPELIQKGEQGEFVPAFDEGVSFPEKLVTALEKILYDAGHIDIWTDESLFYSPLEKWEDNVEALDAEDYADFYPGIYGAFRFSPDGKKAYYVFEADDGGTSGSQHVYVAEYREDGPVEINEFAVESCWASDVICYEGEFYYVFIQNNYSLKVWDGIRIYKLLGTEYDNLEIRYLPERFVWEPFCDNHSEGNEVNGEIEACLDTVKEELASGGYIDSGTSMDVYYGDEEEVPGLRIDASNPVMHPYEPIYKVDLANCGLPVYLWKTEYTPSNTWTREHLKIRFFYCEEKEDAFVELENLSREDDPGGQFNLVQMWFREIGGKIYTFRLYHVGDYIYMLNIVLLEGDNAAQIGTYIAMPRRHFVLTEGEACYPGL